MNTEMAKKQKFLELLHDHAGDIVRTASSSDEVKEKCVEYFHDCFHANIALLAQDSSLIKELLFRTLLLHEDCLLIMIATTQREKAKNGVSNEKR